MPLDEMRLLVANRGEIAVRIIQAAREISPPIKIFAIYTKDDRSHCDIGRPHHSLEIHSPDAYLDIDLLVELARKHSINAVHPGYGFLSENANFARRVQEAGIEFIGPDAEILQRTGDKIEAKKLAKQCNVPILPAMSRSTSDFGEIEAFAKEAGYPLMVKAVDGGGGRGIRLVQQQQDLKNAVRSATNESPSRTVFLEKAAINGFHHLEVQVIGDGNDVSHLYERDCSVQRKFQKVVEVAPSLLKDRNKVQEVVDAAVRMAKAVRYRYLGTVEFLVNELTGEFFFLEINPRLQVEHTITEGITGMDLVQLQLRLAQGHSLQELGLTTKRPSPNNGHSIQLRLCAEDPNNAFSLSLGKITEFSIPSGNGIRVDTHVDMFGVVVGADFDSLLAKIITTASTWQAAVLKARRVLSDTRISGVKTNLDLLKGIVNHDDFLAGKIDIQWLEENLNDALRLGGQVSKSSRQESSRQVSRSSGVPNLPSSNFLFRRGDAWSVILEPLKPSNSDPLQHHLQLTRVLRNDFPTSLSAEVEYTTPSSSTPYRLHLATTNTSASALTSSSHRRGDPRNSRHIILPLSGKLVEILVAPGDAIVKNQVVAFVKQMKMELEVRSPQAGKAKWVHEMEDDEADVAEGILLVELEDRKEKL
ncbi:Hypothetical protein R9X50_00444900 [Acrodontium crateriforme]|uniref:Pyruvate carboxylase n=1 Tax=Acrodontium crateriforme TaxID=150365 RepID=A0AAQ3M806_9PEZI|nr:Hypothetical protein R9X50_00444900 [Acrodontium crateriforme]